MVFNDQPHDIEDLLHGSAWNMTRYFTSSDGIVTSGDSIVTS